MKQKLFLFFFLILMIVVLAGLNAASYVQKEKTPDSEWSPNRSTYNVGATGSSALFALLSESGRKVMRWQEPLAALNTDKKNTPTVFVVIGAVRRAFTDAESESLLRWVSHGGRLVVIDREPPESLVSTTADWQITCDSGHNPFDLAGVDPSDQNQMTANTAAIKPSQPTAFTHSVNAIQPSRLAGSIRIERFDGDQKYGHDDAPPPPRRKPTVSDDEDGNSDLLFQLRTPTEGRPPPPKAASRKPYAKPTSETVEGAITVSSYQSAPVVHFASASKNVLVEAPYGQGKIVYLTDPYMVSNSGISLADNAQLAINVLSTATGSIAFDEYHQGYGANDNKFLEFFAGTPLVSIFLQGLMLVGFIFFSQSRRFARPVPEPEPDRLSKLEYVSAMAELQQRTSAFDLAIENIYSDFRRRATRLLGADNYTVRYDELAGLIAERSGANAASVADTLHKCEEIIRGEPTNKREVLELAGKLRVLEEKLGLTRNRRGKV